MKFLTLFFVSLLSFYGHAQTNATTSLSDSARLKTKVKGTIKQFLRWTDRFGDNYLVLTETDEIRSSARTSTSGGDCTTGCTDKELHAYHFIRKDSLLWTLTDFQKACSLDNLVSFRNGASKITDLDKNGLAEIWIMYSLACASDVSPRTLKLIMYQGNKKYAVRGTSQPSKNQIDKEYGGRYIPDKEFQRLPKVFHDFAAKHWAQHLYDLE